MGVKNHISYTKIASAASQHTQIDAKSINWIANDGGSDITFNFEDDVTGTGSTGSLFIVKAGDVLNDIDQPVTDLYYICTAADTTFRIFGKAK
jgi:hypothetical protein